VKNVTFDLSEVHSKTGQLTWTYHDEDSWDMPDEEEGVSIRGTTCCGMKVLSGLQDYQEQFWDCPSVETTFAFIAYAKFGAVDFGALVFTAIVEESYGEDRTEGDELKRLIEKEGFGTVDESLRWFNPNSENWVKTYTWRFNEEETCKFEKWYDDNTYKSEFSHEEAC